MTPTTAFHLEVRASLESIHALKDDWDDDGAKSFNTDHLKTIQAVLTDTLREIWKYYHLNLATPGISACHNGSVDIHFKTDRGELLINVPENVSASTFYGERFDYHSAQGKLNLTENRDLSTLTYWIGVCL